METQECVTRETVMFNEAGVLSGNSEAKASKFLERKQRKCFLITGCSEWVMKNQPTRMQTVNESILCTIR